MTKGGLVDCFWVDGETHPDTRRKAPRKCQPGNKAVCLNVKIHVIFMWKKKNKVYYVSEMVTSEVNLSLVC